MTVETRRSPHRCLDAVSSRRDEIETASRPILILLLLGKYLSKFTVATILFRFIMRNCTSQILLSLQKKILVIFIRPTSLALIHYWAQIEVI